MQQTVLVVGASSGIGEALAKQYAEAGWKVGVTGRREALLQRLVTAYPQQIQAFVFDVCADDALRHFQQALETLGNTQVIVYSSGVGELNQQLLEDIETRTVEVNVTAFTRFAIASYHYFEQQGGGQFAAISSVASRRGERGSPAYNASKAYMSNYLEGLRKKAFRRKLPLAICDIRPGFVDTPMAKGPGLFWVAPVEKAAKQIKMALESKKEVVYITKRWALVAWLIERMPSWLWKRL